MLNNTNFLILICTLALAITGCERAVEKSQVSISLPSYSALSTLDCTGTKCLKALILNVNGSNFKTIVVDNKHDNMSEPDTQISPEITVDVPSGPDRNFQIFAVYRETNGGMSAQFGSSVVDLNSAEPPPVVITLSSPSNFLPGSLVGRYLTGSDSGPSGKVNVSLKFQNTEQRIQIGKSEILNGWFDFFASQNFQMTYTLENGTVLFADKSLNDFTTSNSVVRMRQPATYFRNQSGWVSEKGQDIVYGFFGTSAAYTSGKNICLQFASAPQNLSNVSSNSIGSVLMTYSHNNTSADFYGIGGLNSNADSPCLGTNNSIIASRYESNRISINQSQLNGYGNDTARSIAGGFSYIIDQSNQTFKYRSAGNVYKLQTLPDVFYGTNALFNGIKIYKKAGAPSGGIDNLQCTSSYLNVPSVFSELASSDYSIAPYVSDPDSIIFALASSSDSTAGYVACPTSDGNLTGLGGFYLNNLSSFGARAMLKISDGPVYAYPSTAALSSSDKTFTITNIGPATANSITDSSNFGATFSYVGGSYPGGGTCGTTLAGGGTTCTINVRFAPSAPSTNYDGIINIYYNDGVITNNPAVRPIKGQSN